MRARRSPRPPKLLRWIAAWLIRGPQAQYVLDDLDELMARDMVVCMLACIVPARHALRVQPTEALRAEA